MNTLCRLFSVWMLLLGMVAICFAQAEAPSSQSRKEAPASSADAPKPDVEKVKRVPFATEKFHVWTPDVLDRVFQKTACPADAPRAVTLEAARGEVVSGQIALRCQGVEYANTNGYGVDRVDAGPLRPVGGGAGEIKVEPRWVGQTFVPEAAPVDAVRREGSVPGFYPDPLYPVYQAQTAGHHFNPDHSIALLNGRTQALWLTVRVPRDIAPGEYTGEVAVHISYYGDVVRIPVRLTVYPAQLPEKPTCGVENWFSIASVPRQHECQWWSDRFWQLISAYLRNLADHRQTHIVVPMYELIEFKVGADGQLQLGWDRFDRFVKASLEAGIPNLTGNHLATYLYGGAIHPCGVHSYRVADGKVRYELHEGRTKAAQDWLAWFLPRLRDHLRENGWLDRWWQHIRDEPGGDILADYVAIRTAVKKYAPEFRTIDALHGPVVDQCDCWVPALNGWGANYDFFCARQKAGDQVWTYICCGPVGKYANRFIDQKSILPRLVFWIMARYGATGYLHWGYNWSDQQLPQIDATTFLPSLGPVESGDVCVVYPGQNGPYDSIRWEMQRAGLQDYELLRLLEAKDAEKAKTLMSEIIQSFQDYNTDTAAFRAARSKLLKALSP